MDEFIIEPAVEAVVGTVPTEAAQRAMAILRDGGQFQWYVIPLFALVVYAYANEIERRKWNLVFAGLAFWGMDWFNEIWNSLFFQASGYAPCWSAPGQTAYLIFVGLNIEICFLFALAGLTFSKMLPADKKLRVLGVPNRLFFALTGSAFCVFVEVLLNAIGALVWDYPWWSATVPYLIFLFGYLHFFLVAFWVHDMATVRKQATTVGIIFAVDIVAILVFGVGLGWL